MSLTLAIPGLVVGGAGLVASLPMRAMSLSAAAALRRKASIGAVSSAVAGVALYVVLPSRQAITSSCSGLGSSGLLIFVGLLTAALGAIAVGAAIRTRNQEPVAVSIGFVVALAYVVPVLLTAVGACGR